MSKIGILTFHRQDNYGALLQSYALMIRLKQMGHEAEFIDYRPSWGEHLRRSPETIQRYGTFEKALLAFAESRFPVSETFGIEDKDFPEHFRKYDIIVEGSDQIWNTELTAGDPVLFLEGIPNDVRAISYAASFGTTAIHPSYKKRFYKLFERLAALSVREWSGKNIIDCVIDKKVEVVLDPTMLVSPGIWDEMEPTIPIPSGHYILLYSLSGERDLFVLAKQLKKRLGYPVVLFGHPRIPHINESNCTDWGVDQYVISGPETFVSLFRSSSCVVTDSYHGTLFSILFQKQFFTTPVRNNMIIRRMSSRIHHILNMFSLSDRMILGDNGPSLAKADEIPYSQVARLLERERALSNKYLENALR